MSKRNCKLAKGFTIKEKIWAQVSFFGMGIIGSVVTMQHGWQWGVPYMIFCWYGIVGVVMRHLNCPRCPHFHEYGDCLQAPLWLPKIAQVGIKRKINKPFTITEKSFFYFYFFMVPTFPVYFLLSNKPLLILFLILVAMWYGGQFLYFCKACRVKECPFNQVGYIG